MPTPSGTAVLAFTTLAVTLYWFRSRREAKLTQNSLRLSELPVPYDAAMIYSQPMGKYDLQ